MEATQPGKVVYLVVFGVILFFASFYNSAFASHWNFGKSHFGKSNSIAYAENTFIFNPRSHTWKAVSNGRVIRSGRASGGSRYCRDIGRSCRTPSGTYHVISKGGPGCRSARYPVGRGGAQMPYCMFYSRYYAVHGSYDVPNYNASHGCIRVHPEAARWLSSNFMHIGTRVVVQSY